MGDSYNTLLYLTISCHHYQGKEERLTCRNEATRLSSLPHRQGPSWCAPTAFCQWSHESQYRQTRSTFNEEELKEWWVTETKKDQEHWGNYRKMMKRKKNKTEKGKLSWGEGMISKRNKGGGRSSEEMTRRGWWKMEKKENEVEQEGK